jgi:CRISPR/Cas system-associated exonuclease Cas4 (RecB family)
VEIVRRVLAEAERGVSFDRMAILVHSVDEYRRHLEEALARAEVPAHFVRGTLTPDPAGRAFVALLACAAENLSARRFAEFLSLGEVPRAEADGSPPPAMPTSEWWVPPDEDLVPEKIVESAMSQMLEERAKRAEEEERDKLLEQDPNAVPVQAGTLRVPRHWEQLLNEAAVIGGHERWVRRLDGLALELQHRLEGMEEPGDPAAEVLHNRIAELSSLRSYGLPLLRMLNDLPAEAGWGRWIELLSTLATRALRRPHRVLAVLAELEPMAPIGPVSLSEVKLVLTRRLTEVVVQPHSKRYGAVFVAPPESARGLAFDVVFVPGLTEKLFPRRILEDPILSDAVRARVEESLITDEERVQRERQALRTAVGAARERLCLSYSRLDLVHARPRVPSFYCLEVLRAAQGRLPGFGELSRMAEVAGAARLSWPAPERPRHGIDVAEHDLALLERILRQEPDEAARTVAHLLTTNPHLGRAVRFRAQRWSKKWTPADGLVRPSPSAREALSEHLLSARSYSATALQNYAVCPYRFLLYAIHRLSPREVPEAVDELDPLQRGSLIHEIQFWLFRRLQEVGLLPVEQDNLERVLEQLERLIGSVTARYRDACSPAIDRVWDDGVAAVRADLREWLRRATTETGGWVPHRFELAFGLPKGHAGTEGEMQDPRSSEDPVALDCGIRLRGKIDLVERNPAGHLRVTDHKSGKVRVKRGAVVEGGQALQPVLYGLAAEKLLGSPVESGRLYYCTMLGGFAERTVVLDERALHTAERVVEAIRLGLDRGFLPAAPVEGGCDYCDYLRVCGRSEERRVKRKGKKAIKELAELRELP